MPSRVIMRLDVTSWKSAFILAGICVAWFFASIIIFRTGPHSLNASELFAYQCPSGSHVWSPECKGSQMAYLQPSPLMTTKTGTIDHSFYLTMNLFQLKPQHVALMLPTYINLEGKFSKPNSDQHNQWLPIYRNASKMFEIDCYGWQEVCATNLIAWSANIHYSEYRASVQFAQPPDTNYRLHDFFGDVGFRILVSPDSYAKLTIGFKEAYAAIGIALTAFWIGFMVLWSKFPFSSWNWEQRYLTYYLIGLNFFNNPLFPIHYFSNSPFFAFLNPFLETAFVSFAWVLWILHIRRFSKMVKYENYIAELREFQDRVKIEAATGIESNIPAPELQLVQEPTDYDPIIDWSAWPLLGLVVFYILITTALYIWNAVRENAVPAGGYAFAPFGFQVLFYISTASYTGLVLLLLIMVTTNGFGARQHRELLWGRYVFFSIPTAAVAVGLCICLIFNAVNPTGNSLFGALVYGSLFNLYAYFMTWAYWPQEGSYTMIHDSGETKGLFGEARGVLPSDL